MPQMPVQRLSSRYLRWAAAWAATALIPTLHRRVPMYRKAIPVTEAGRAETIEETQSLTLSPSEMMAAQRTREGVPAQVKRSIALVALTGATILGNTGTIIDEKNKQMLVPREGRSYATYHELRGETTKPVIKKDGIYFNMLGLHRSHRHHYHFLIDYLPRLHYFLDRFPEGKQTVTVLVNEDISAVQSSIFGALAAKYRNIRFEAIPRRERWTLPVLYQIDDFQSGTDDNIAVHRSLMGASLVQFLRDTAFAACNITPGQHGGRRLYLARSDTKKRQLLNESELSAALSRNGFETIVPGTMSFGEQVEAFSQASVICGAHGAAFTNIVFAPPGAHIIEILPANRAVSIYLMLAKSAGQTYESIIGTPEMHHQNFTCDTDQVTAALDSLSQSGGNRAA